jgi:hypothetical protein
VNGKNVNKLVNHDTGCKGPTYAKGTDRQEEELEFIIATDNAGQAPPSPLRGKKFADTHTSRYWRVERSFKMSSTFNFQFFYWLLTQQEQFDTLCCREMARCSLGLLLLRQGRKFDNVSNSSRSTPHEGLLYGDSSLKTFSRWF